MHHLPFDVSLYSPAKARRFVRRRRIPIGEAGWAEIEGVQMSEARKPETGTFGWIDLTVDDAPRIRAFYESVVGWRSTEVAMDGYSDFTMCAPSTGNPVAGVCHARGGNAGLPAQWLLYVTVDDIDASAARCRELGGTVIREPTEMGSHGRYAVIEDPAGAVLALFAPAS
jgi:predicted enzyme related to lactoylglutathione lyase